VAALGTPTGPSTELPGTGGTLESSFFRGFVAAVLLVVVLTAFIVVVVVVLLVLWRVLRARMV
jgi:hypothetical protein